MVFFVLFFLNFTLQHTCMISASFCSPVVFQNTPGSVEKHVIKIIFNHAADKMWLYLIFGSQYWNTDDWSLHDMFNTFTTYFHLSKMCIWYTCWTSENVKDHIWNYCWQFVVFNKNREFKLYWRPAKYPMICSKASWTSALLL